MVDKINILIRRYKLWLKPLGGYFSATFVFIMFAIIFYFYRSEIVPFIITLGILFGSYFSPQLTLKFSKNFHSYTGEYRKSLLDYANSLKCNIKDVYENSSNELDATSFGFGNNKIVCFSSAIFKRFKWDEIQAVMSHEIGHHHNGDSFIYTFLVIFILGVVSNLGSIFQIFEIQKLIGIIIILSVPFYFLGIALMRWREQQADNFVKQHLVNTVGFGNALKKIVKEDDDRGIYTPVKPTLLLRLLCTHPWIHDRIQRFS